jgi:hypothetical protein
MPVAFDMPIFITVRNCDAMFVTRQWQSCQLPSFGMAVPVSTRNNYVALVRHRMTIRSNRKGKLQLPTISVKGSIQCPAHNAKRLTRRRACDEVAEEEDFTTETQRAPRSAGEKKILLELLSAFSPVWKFGVCSW